MITEKGINLIKHFEQCRLKAYLDSKNIWTIGWGSIRINGRAVQEGDEITQDQADKMFVNELKYMTDCVDKLLGSHQIAPCKRDALISFAYNCGPDIDADDKAEGLGDSTLLKKVLHNPNDPSIRDEFIKWRNKGTRSEKGLLRRRLAEAYLYFTCNLRFEWDDEIRKIMNK